MKLPTKTKKIEHDLSAEELSILKSIVSVPSALGAFSGMIANQQLTYPQHCPIKLIEKAIRLRKLVQDMSNS